MADYFGELGTSAILSVPPPDSEKEKAAPESAANK